MKTMNRAMRTTAAVISLALIHSSFSPIAWAQLVPRVGDVSAPVGGNSSAAGSASSVGAGNNAVAVAMPAASLTASAVSFAAPMAAMSLPASAIAGPASAAPARAASLSLTRSAAPVAAPIAAAAPAAAAFTGSAAASISDKGNDPAKAALPSARAAAAAPAEAPTAIKGGPRTATVGARMARRMAELKSFFTGKNAGAAPSESAPAAALDGLEQNEAAHPTGLAPASAVSDSSKVATSGGDNAPPAPPAPPSEGPKDGGNNGKSSKGPFLGLGLAGLSIIGYMLTMQVGLEAQGVAMPQLTENAFKDFTLLPLVTVFASIGSMIGQPMSKFFTEKFGLGKTFYGAQALRAISLGAMVLLFGTGMMSMPLMMAFYFLNGIVTGVSATAEGTLRKLILAEKGISQQSFRTWWQFLAESLAVPAPMIFGALVLSLGAIGAPLVTAVYPITILLGLILAYVLKVYPLKDVKKASETFAQAAAKADADAKASAEAPAPAAPKKGVWQRIKETGAQIFRNMEEGKAYVMSVPYLKYSLAAAAVFDLFNILIYRLIAPGYGKMTGGEGGLSAISGNIVGMFSLGGLLLSVVFIVMENVAKNRAKTKANRAAAALASAQSEAASAAEAAVAAETAGDASAAELRKTASEKAAVVTALAAADAAAQASSPQAAAAAERSSMLRWAMAGIPALGLLATMAFQIALPLAPFVFAGTNWMPSSMLAAALIPFGFLQVAASIKLNSYFQEKLPHDAGKVQKALAFSGSVMTALSIVTMLAMRPLFSAVNVFNPFPWLAAVLLPAAAIGLFFLIRKLAAATKPEAVAAADEAQKNRDDKNDGASSGYVGAIIGIVAAAVVITALPMIPGIAGFMAGLGVMAKFAINLALTVALPLAGWFYTRAKGASKKPSR